MTPSTSLSSIQCPITGRSEGRLFVDIPQVPVLCNVLYDSRGDALDVPRGDVKLCYFPTSGHVYNVAFDPHKIEYSQAYENSLHYSPRFQKYATELADRLIDTYDVRGKTVVDIGCGKGDFLALLCERGGNTGVGFDPSYEPDRDAGERPFTVVQDLYSEKYADYPADLICCQHVLEHVEDPLAFAEMVRRAVGDRRDTVLYFEVPNALFTLRDFAIWDLIYEHCSYFTPSSLAYLFRRAGFEVLRVGEAFNGQYLQIELRPGTPETEPELQGERRPVHVEPHVSRFGGDYERKRRHWQEWGEAIETRGETVVLWGAGSKGVSFLNAIPEVARAVEYVVDINPHKQGKFVAGTGQQIIPPSFLGEHRPDVVILMNGIYEDEIRTMVHELGLAPAFAVAT